MSVFLEEGVDPRDPPVPRVLQVLQREPSVLSCGLLPLQSILSPHSLAVDELTLPWLDVTEEEEEEEGGRGEEEGVLVYKSGERERESTGKGWGSVDLRHGSFQSGSE